jgi:hypothetical protein
MVASSVASLYSWVELEMEDNKVVICFVHVSFKGISSAIL